MKITGLIAAPVTPFRNDDSIAPETVPDYAKFLIDQGVSGVFVNGTTGEGFSLTDTERKVMTEAWCAEKNANFKVIIHVGHTSQKTSRELAEHATSFGADAIGEMGPIFFKPTSVDGLVNYCSVTASSTNLPYYYYHMPSMNGLHFKMTEFLEIAESKIPTLCGIKYTHFDVEDFSQSLKFKDQKFDLLFGRDEALLKALSAGAEGAVGSTYNCFAPLYLSLINQYKSGHLEEAEILQQESINIINSLAAVSFFSALRHSMRIQGLETGEPRLPLNRLTLKQKNNLEKQLEIINALSSNSRSLSKKI